MPRSRAATVEAYLEELPEERRAVLARVRGVVLANLPDGYVEAIRWGMISWEIPLARYPGTYNGQPLGYAGLAAQKSHFALYLMGACAEPAQRARLEDAFRATGKRLDMGQACLRFRSLDDLPLDAVAEAIASTPPERYIRLHEAARERRG